MRFRSFLFAMLPLAVATAPPSVYAGSVTAYLNNLSPVSSVDVKHDGTGGSGPIYTTYTEYNGIGGRFNWTLQSTSGTMLGDWTSVGIGGTFYSMCIQLNQSIGYGSSSFTEATLSSLYTLGDQRGTELSKLYGSSWNNGNFGSGPAADIAAAGFQLAVWEIVQDGAAGFGALDLTQGHFLAYNTNASVVNAAQNYLAAASTSLLTQSLVALVDTTLQDQVIAISLAHAPDPVPLPGAAAAAVPILMLGGTALKSKRRRQRAEDSVVA